MEQTYEESLSQLLIKLMDGMDSAVAFGTEQMPDLIDQLLVWKLSMAWVGFLIPLSLVLVITFVLYRIHKGKPFRNADEALPAMVILIVIGAFLMIPVCYNVYDIVQMSLAPKIYILEYANDLINGPRK